MTLSADTVDNFRQLEENLWLDEPLSRDEVLSEDFEEFCRFGDIYDRNHLIDAPPNGASVAFPFTDFKAESLSEDVVLVTYQNSVTNNGATERARRSSIWVRSDTQWKLRFQQATTLTN